VYEWAKRIVVSEEKKTTWQVAAPFVFGAFARVGSTSLKIPFDVVKQRLEVQGAILNKANHMYSGTLDAFRKISRQEGLAKGLWTGFSVTLIRDLPFSVTYFTTYELSKHYQKVILGWLGLLGPHDLNTANHLVAGATAGCVASFVTMPIDAVKTRVQTEVLTHTGQKGEVAGAPRLTHAPKKSMLATAKVIWAQEGIRGFYRGLVPRLVSIIPSASLTFASYELYKKLLHVD
jgi:solute carrier family 25 iron transporter 28/37